MTMKHRRWILFGCGWMLAWPSSQPARAADAAPTAADINRLEGEIARLQQDLRDQRQLVLQLLQMQEAMMRTLHGGAVPPTALPGAPGAAAPAGSAAAISSGAPAAAAGASHAIP